MELGKYNFSRGFILPLLHSAINKLQKSPNPSIERPTALSKLDA